MRLLRKPSVKANGAFNSVHQSAGRSGAREIWCERGDSNPHGLPRQILSLVRLPIPPLSHNKSTT